MAGPLFKSRRRPCDRDEPLLFQTAHLTLQQFKVIQGHRAWCQ